MLPIIWIACIHIGLIAPILWIIFWIFCLFYRCIGMAISRLGPQPVKSDTDFEVVQPKRAKICDTMDVDQLEFISYEKQLQYANCKGSALRQLVLVSNALHRMNNGELAFVLPLEVQDWEVQTEKDLSKDLSHEYEQNERDMDATLSGDEEYFEVVEEHERSDRNEEVTRDEEPMDI